MLCIQTERKITATDAVNCFDRKSRSKTAPAWRTIMTGIYFSGTGNTRHCITKFIDALSVYDAASPEQTARIISIEESVCAANAIQSEQELLLLAYPVYYSNLPKIMRDFIVENKELWKGKKIFILCTMALFSGDGAGVAARLLREYGADIIGGLHIIMPDCISDVKLLKFSPEKNREIIIKAERKLENAARKTAAHRPPQEGLNLFAHLSGLFGQRLWFARKMKHYSDKLTIHPEACIKCGRCATVCPMHNLTLTASGITAAGKCTMCYRCINQCPQKAITLIGKRHCTTPRSE